MSSEAVQSKVDGSYLLRVTPPAEARRPSASKAMLTATPPAVSLVGWNLSSSVRTTELETPAPDQAIVGRNRAVVREALGDAVGTDGVVEPTGVSVIEPLDAARVGKRHGVRAVVGVRERDRAAWRGERGEQMVAVAAPADGLHRVPRGRILDLIQSELVDGVVGEDVQSLQERRGAIRRRNRRRRQRRQVAVGIVGGPDRATSGERDLRGPRGGVIDVDRERLGRVLLGKRVLNGGDLPGEACGSGGWVVASQRRTARGRVGRVACGRPELAECRVGDRREIRSRARPWSRHGRASRMWRSSSCPRPWSSRRSSSWGRRTCRCSRH